MTTFLRPVFFTASGIRGSSQVFMVVRSNGLTSGNTACTSGNRGPLKLFSATVVRIVGTPKAFAVLASPVTLFWSSTMSMDFVAKAICGW